MTTGTPAADVKQTKEALQQYGHREDWRPVRGWEGIYSVSNQGRVRRDGTSSGAHVGRILRPIRGAHYLKVTLSRPAGRCQTYIHVLVAEAFLGPRPLGMDANHIDGNRCNNSKSNLEWVTRQENIKHAYRIGIRKVFGPPAVNAARTHCVHGHPLSGRNLAVVAGQRRCRACASDEAQRRRRRKAVAA